MAHAQRLLPLEQLLSEAAAQVNSPPRPQGTAPVRTSAESRRTTSDPGTATRSNYVSPFAADSARKGTPKAEIASEPASQAGPRLVATASATAVVMGATAPAPAVLNAPKIATGPEPVAPAEEPAISESVPVNSDVSALRNSILNAVADAGHRMVASMLESGEWRVEGNELQIKVAASPTVIDMSLGADAKRVIVAAAREAERNIRGNRDAKFVARHAQQRIRPWAGRTGTCSSAHAREIRRRDQDDH
jgi:hypothetical protein